jgi:hypothetical protein
MNYDDLVLWALVILLCLVTLTTGREWWNALRKIYRHAIAVWKWQPYLGYITGGKKGKKPHISESEFGAHVGEEHKTIFPRSRRST